MFDSNVFYSRLHSLGIIYNLDWDMTPLNTLFLLHGPTTKTSLTVGINIPLSVAAPPNLVACHHYSNVALGLVVDICCYCGGSVGGGASSIQQGGNRLPPQKNGHGLALEAASDRNTTERSNRGFSQRESN